MKTLPSLNALRALDAALRSGSVTAAAKRLSVTPGAVSHQIRLLEDTFGCKLLERNGRLLTPTAAAREGEALLRDGFERISQAAESFRRAGDPNSLAVSLSGSLAARWMVFHAESFFRQWPDVDLRFRAHWGAPDLASEGVDLAIRFGRGGFPGYKEKRLTSEVFFPVCSQEFLLRNPSIGAPSDIASRHLLHVDSSALSYDYPTWPDWLKQVGYKKRINERAGHTYRSDELSLRNARFGKGLALGYSTLIQTDLQRGVLIRPFPEIMASSLGYHLIYSDAALERPVVAAFADWLTQAMGASAASVSPE